MLQIKDIRKTYVTGDLVQTALDGVSLNLRDNEFVAILGPSGSGKTTLLNVIGGLDRYDSGDLVINGISTEKYTDRDWDSYRNHTIGFVFQSYNLIPHQSVLANVELALTISGISRAERRRRATKALEDVGLGNQLHKRPNQMSGGQMQRVAIARALVNDPDILLADEPTGALDSETSVQVMDLLKEVSRDRLVVMVTHNPELAEDYANRIVRVRDGRIIGDTNPFLVDDASLAAPTHRNMGKATMSFFTALSLSFNNLLTKKARTLLTAFAGSIGIIGIALIMSLSTGFQKYIDKIQADTLSNYPLTIQSETSDMGSAFAAFGASMQAAREAEEGTVVEQQMISQMFAQIGKNDLASFKKYLEDHYDEIGYTISSIKYSYGITPRIYCEDMTYGILQANPSTLFNQIMGNSFIAAYMNPNMFYEMIDDREMLESQYEVLEGRWPESYDELIIVLQDPSQITDYMSFTLGLRDPAELEKIISKVMAGEEVDSVEAYDSWTYEQLLNLRLRLISVPDLYRYNEEYQVWEDMSTDEAYMKEIIPQGDLLRIVGIVCAKEGVNATALTTGVAYTTDLTRYVIGRAEESEIVQNQLDNENTDVFSGTPFSEKSESELDFQDMITVDSNAISSAFGMNISGEGIMNLLNRFLNENLESMKVDTAAAQNDFKTLLSDLGKEMLREFVAANDDGSGSARLYLSDADGIVSGYLASENAGQKIQALADKYGIEAEQFREIAQPLLVGMIASHVASDLSGSDGTVPPESTEPEGTPEETQGAEETQPAEETAPGQTAETVQEPTPQTETEPEMPSDDTAETAPPADEAPTATEPPADGEAEAPEDSGESEVPPTTDDTETPPSSDDSDTQVTIDPSQLYAPISADQIDGLVDGYTQDALVEGAAAAMAVQMMAPQIRNTVSSKLQEFGNTLSWYIGSSFYVDGEKIANAFQFNMDQEELQRLMAAMSGQNQERSALTNLQGLGYADLDVPTSISIYFRDFETKEEFIAFLDNYNDQMQLYCMEDYVIRYTDMTGIMMSSVRTIIDSVSYALIAFVAVSLVVSSIMIGIITYISVMERTKEIGVLRAIGASKRNISQVFNAETFIIGLCSGLIGIGVTLLVLIPGNMLIQHLTNNPDIVAQLPVANAVVLILLSMVLTLIGGFIPAKQAAKKDPVIALRSE